MKKNWGKITNINKYRKKNKEKGIVQQYLDKFDEEDKQKGKRYTAVVYEDGGYYELMDSYGSKGKAISGIQRYKEKFPRMKNKKFKVIEQKDFKSYGVNTKR